MEKDQMGELLDYCSKIPEVYNKVSIKLYRDFGICSAEVTLICTYIFNELNKEADHDVF